MDFVFVERVIELLHVEQEPLGTVSPPAWWPSYNGDIVLEDVTIRSGPHLGPRSSSILLRIRAGPKTAIIGRTGSGKSTLASALLATIIPESGRILIDGIDISTVGTQALRSRVTGGPSWPKDPSSSPDPCAKTSNPSQHSDVACKAILSKICEEDHHQWKLDRQINISGRNLSQGQRQLIGLARAVLRRSPVVILDEATASIDLETALRIHEILRQEMEESTLNTITHRLEAVRDADYIILCLGR